MRFSIITYNQEDVVLFTLESIKWQIQEYGKYSIDSILVFDDCSSDRTVETCQEWMHSNADLCARLEIRQAPSNLGIVRNFLRAATEGAGQKNKVIAGDDLFTQENVYDAIPESGILLSPVLPFDDCGVIKSELPIAYARLASSLNQTGFKALFEKFWKKYNFIDAPGVFFSSSIFLDEQLQEYVGQYTWIEDQPLWHYLSRVTDDLSNISITTKSYVMYRQGRGVSSTKRLFESFANTPMRNEARLQNKRFHPKGDTIAKAKLNLLADIVYRKICWPSKVKNTPAIQAHLKIYHDSMNAASEHLSMIEKRVNDYVSSNR